MTLRDFIVCDDIRREVGNKHTLVGVYDGSIEFGSPPAEAGKWPKALRLGFFVRVRLDKGDRHPDSFTMHAKFDGTDDEEIGKGQITVSGPTQRNLNLVILHGRFVLPKESTMTFLLRFYSGGESVAELSVDDGVVIRARIGE